MSARRGERRALLAALVGLVAGAACAAKPPVAEPPPAPPLELGALDRLATSAGVVWLVRARPREIAATPFLIPAIARVVPEARLDVFTRRMGLDPRQVREALLLRYDETLGGAEAQLARHDVDPVLLERRFLERLSSDAERKVDHPELVRVTGTIGRTKHAFARLGRDVVAYQQRGDAARGPVAIASLYARGKLTKAPRLLSSEPLTSLVARFGDAPVVAAALGPFSDEWKKGARGLLEVATAVGAAARPTAREHVGVSLALSGGFGADAAKAAEVLRAAWGDVALSTMGHLLGLDKPLEEPLAAGHADVITLAVELDPERLTEGLKALVERDLDTVMSLP